MKVTSEIDVSRCEFYNNNYCSCYIDNYGDCYHKCTDEELKHCYYKQLQQLKQENERNNVMKVIEMIYKEGDDIILQVDSLTRISLKDFIAKVVAETKDEMAQDILEVKD